MQSEAGIARLPRWMLGLAVAGTLAVTTVWGLRAGGGFLLGSLGAWVNLRLLVRAVDRIGRLALNGNTKQVRPGQSGVWVFIQLMALVLGAFVILRLSGFNKIAVLCGFLVCPAAVILEILYELLKYDHS
jgi:ATP synthase I subunit